jgi:hypothetical protein
MVQTVFREERGATGSDDTGNHVTGRGPARKAPESTLTGTGSHECDRLRMRNHFPRFFLTIVVQVPWLPEVTEGHVTQKGFPWKGVRMHNRKLRNIRPSGSFSPEMKK